MLIEEVDLHNFMCYYGHNRFSFSEGLNLVVGDPGYGKSKLFDAFYWVMNDKIFDPEEKEFKPTSHFKRELISDRALNEAEDDDIIESYVSVSFKDDSGGDIYIITRKYTVVTESGNFKESEKSEEIVKTKDLGYLNARIIDNPTEVDRIKKKILPDNIKPYMWFQGEQVESIIDFNKSESLTHAINVLSKISSFDEISDIADDLEKSARKEHNKKLKSLSKDKEKSEELERRYEKLQKDIEYHKKQQLEKEENLERAEQRADELINKIDEAQQIKELDKEKNQTEKKLNNIRANEKEAQINVQKKLFSSKWVLKGCEHLLEEFSTMYDDYQTEKLRQEQKKKVQEEATDELIETLQARLPKNVPEPIYVQRMLDEEICLVCNRKAEKGSEPWNRIKELLTKRKEDQSQNAEERPLQDFSDELKKLYQNGLAVESQLDKVDDDIEETFQELDELSQKRKELANELDDYKSKVRNLISESNLDLKVADDLINEHQQNTEYAKRFREELNDTKHLISEKRQELANVEKELNNLSTGEFPQWLSDKLEILTNFQQVAHSTRQRVFEDLVKILEEEANKHYFEMTKDNLSVRGHIKLEPSSGGNYMPTLVDENGNKLQQLNTSNIILIKLATIMAIVSARQGSRDTELYTLISDAPTSVFGEDYTIGFCKTISNVYKQSIIMSKEFYTNKALREELFENDEINLGKFYMITPAIDESERADRTKLSTNIKALN